MSNLPDENVPTNSSKVRSRSTSPEDKATDKNRRKKVRRIILKYEKLHPFETDISKIEIPPSLQRMTLVRRSLSVPEEEEEGSRQGEGEREESTTVENDDDDDNENIMYSDNATDSNEDGSLFPAAVADPTTDAEVDQEEDQEEEIADEDEYAEEQAEGPQMEEEHEEEEEEENIEDEENCEEEEDNRTIFSIDKSAEKFSAPVQFKHYVTNMQVFLSMLAFSIRAKLTYTSLFALFRSLRSMTINSVFPIYMASL